MDRAVLAIGSRPDLLDRRGQPGRAVGDDQAWRRESAVKRPNGPSAMTLVPGGIEASRVLKSPEALTVMRSR